MADDRDIPRQVAEGGECRAMMSVNESGDRLFGCNARLESEQVSEVVNQQNGCPRAPLSLMPTAHVSHHGGKHYSNVIDDLVHPNVNGHWLRCLKDCSRCKGARSHREKSGRWVWVDRKCAMKLNERTREMADRH